MQNVHLGIVSSTTKMQPQRKRNEKNTPVNNQKQHRKWDLLKTKVHRELKKAVCNGLKVWF